jgi:hypothetical protein
MVAILASLPSKVVNVTVKRVWSGRLELEARKFLGLCFEGIKFGPMRSIVYFNRPVGVFRLHRVVQWRNKACGFRCPIV